MEDWLFGQYGDRNAVLSATGKLQARASFLDTSAFIYADGGVRSLLYAPPGGWEKLKPDIENEGEGDGAAFFDPAVLNRYGDLDFKLAIQAPVKASPCSCPASRSASPGG